MQACFCETCLPIFVGTVPLITSTPRRTRGGVPRPHRVREPGDIHVHVAVVHHQLISLPHRTKRRGIPAKVRVHVVDHHRRRRRRRPTTILRHARRVSGGLHRRRHAVRRRCSRMIARARFGRCWRPRGRRRRCSSADDSREARDDRLVLLGVVAAAAADAGKRRRQIVEQDAAAVVVVSRGVHDPEDAGPPVRGPGRRRHPSSVAVVGNGAEQMARVLVHVGHLEHGRRQRLAPAAAVVLLLHLLLRFATPVAAAPEVVPAEIAHYTQLRLGKFDA